jgi:hypothetical protein
MNDLFRGRFLNWFLIECMFLCPHLRSLEKTELPIYSVKAHKEIINCINGVGGAGIGEGAPELVTGSRDGEW